MGPPVPGVIAGQLAFAREIMIDLDRRNRLDRIRRIRLIPVVDQPGARRPRDEVLNLQRDRVQQLARDDVVRERIADHLTVDHTRCAWIVDRVLHDGPSQRVGAQHAARQGFAEVAVSHAIGRHRLKQTRPGLDLPELFEAVEEEGPVLPWYTPGIMTGPPRLPPKLFLRLGGFTSFPDAVIRERDAGAEFFVHVVLEQAAVNRIGAGLRGQIENTAGDLAVLCGEVARMDRHLFERLDRRLHLIDADHQAVVVRFHALDADLERVDRCTADLERAVGRDVAAWNERDEGIRVPDRRGRLISARSEIERQRIEVLTGHAGRDFGALRIEHRRIGDDVHFLGKVSELQPGVDPGGLPHEDADALLAEPPEARPARC